jgi:hypothetical protein
VFIFILCTSLAQRTIAMSDPNLVALWLFNEGDGKEIVDSSENGNDGTIEGDIQWVDGKFHKAVKLDGQTMRITIKNSDSLDFADDFSFVFWVKTTQVKGNLGGWWNGGWIFSKDMPGQADCQDWDIACTEGKLVFVTGNAETDVDDLLVSTDPISDGEWHHIAVTRERKSGLKTMYIDGAEDVSEEQGPDLSVSNAIDVTLCGNPEGLQYCFEGLLDDMALYDRFLSQDEIQSIMESGAQSVEPAGKLPTAWGKLKLAKQ